MSCAAQPAVSLLTDQAKHASTLASLSNRLRNASASRQPLQMQRHRRIAIPTFAPRFETDFTPGRHYDPDTDRNAAAKLRSQYKKERKGAIRELRKDARFMADVKSRERRVKDEAYDKRMRSVMGGLGSERAEEKEMER